MPTPKFFKNICFVFISLFLSATVEAQHFSIVGQVGIGRVFMDRNYFNFSPKPKQKVMPSGTFGISFLSNKEKPIGLGIQLIVNQIEGREKNVSDATDQSGKIVGTITAIYSQHLTYLGLPIFVALKTKRLDYYIGGQIQYLLTSSASSKAKGELYGQKFESTNKFKSAGIEQIDYGPKLEAVFKFNQKLGASLSLYQGLNNLGPNGSTILKIYNQQALLGIRYSIGKSKTI